MDPRSNFLHLTRQARLQVRHWQVALLTLGEGDLAEDGGHGHVLLITVSSYVVLTSLLGFLYKLPLLALKIHKEARAVLALAPFRVRHVQIVPSFLNLSPLLLSSRGLFCGLILAPWQCGQSLVVSLLIPEVP